MLTPSDKTTILTKAIEMLNGSEGVDSTMIADMAKVLEAAKEEEIMYHMEEDDYWEQCKEDYIQRQVDKRRGK